MNREEIETRIEICERRANAYNEVGNIKIVDKYEHEKYKWEKLLSDLDLLNKKNINELLEYKRAYYKQKEVIDKINLIIKGIAYGENEDYYIEKINKINELLKEVSKWKINSWKMVYSHWSMIKKH